MNLKDYIFSGVILAMLGWIGYQAVSSSRKLAEQSRINEELRTELQKTREDLTVQWTTGLSQNVRDLQRMIRDGDSTSARIYYAYKPNLSLPKQIDQWTQEYNKLRR